MNQTKFTPGPWIVDRGEGYSEKYPRNLAVRSDWDTPKEGGNALGYEVCKLSGVHDRSEANAQLIAAAPELYAVLKAVTVDQGLLELIDSIGEKPEFWDRALAALALARGEKGGAK